MVERGGLDCGRRRAPNRAVRRWVAAPLVIALSLAFVGAPRAQSVQVSASTSILDQPSVREIASVGMDHLYDLRFAEASVSFDAIDREFPRHPIGPFLKSLTTWWTILLDLSDESHDKEFFDSMEEVIKRCDRLLRNDPQDVDALFFKGAALGFRGRLRSNRGDWFKAALDGKKAMDYVLDVADLDPGNHDYVFGKGIYDYFAVVVPEEHPFVKPVMGLFPRGNRQRGLDLLERTASQGHYVQTEAVYFLLQINYLYERDFAKCVEYATWLRERYPDNSYFHAIEGRIYAQWGRWTQSAEIFERVLERYSSGDAGYNAAIAEQAAYYLARERMVRRDFEAALDYLLQVEALSARTGADTYYKVLGRLRQGMALDALGQRDPAVQRYREVLRMKDWSEAHSRARGYLDRPYR